MTSLQNRLPGVLAVLGLYVNRQRDLRPAARYEPASLTHELADQVAGIQDVSSTNVYD